MRCIVQDLSSTLQDLAAINKEKLQLQREFDAYKDLTAQVSSVFDTGAGTWMV